MPKRTSVPKNPQNRLSNLKNELTSAPKGILLAIDPGNIDSAWMLFDLAECAFLDFGICFNNELLELMKWRLFSYLAIEMIGNMGGCPGDDVFETAMWVGRFIQSSASMPHTRLYRKEVVNHICGDPNAGDKEVRAELIKRYGSQLTKGIKYDCWSALAIATTFHDYAHRAFPT